MKVLLVEDNLEQVESLERHIRECLGEKTVIIGPYDQFSHVLPYVAKKDISLALVDIQLHDDRYAGIHIAEMLQQLSDIPILFISGITDEKVVEQAKGVLNSDFLQKPFDSDAFKRAIERGTKSLESRSNEVKITFRPRSKDRYWVKTDRASYQGVNQKDILFVKAWDHYCKIYVQGFDYPLITKASLKRDILEGGLSQYPHFYLLNRSTVINLNHIEQIQGNILCVAGLELKGNDMLVIPKDKREELLQQLGITK